MKGSIINDAQTLRQFLRVGFTNNGDSLPNFQAAADRFLIPIIGRPLFDDVLDNILEADFPDPDEMTEDYEPEYEDPDLVQKIRAVVAPLAYFLELPTIQVNLTESGLRSISTDTMEAAHRWEYNAFKDSLADSGSFAMDELLRYLFANKEEYELWTDSDEYGLIKELIFTTGTDFNRYFPLFQAHRVFWKLRPLIKEVQDFYIAPAIGEVFFNSLLAKPELTNEEKKVLDFIKKAAAQYTILKSIEKQLATQTNDGFTILLNAGNSDSANAGATPATDNSLSLLYTSCEKTGDAYILKLKEYLNKTATAQVLPDYYNSEIYSAPSTFEKISPNANRKIFGL